MGSLFHLDIWNIAIVNHYYFNASTYLLSSDSSMLPAYGVALSLLGLVLIWLVYDLLCKTKLVDKPIIFIGILFLIITLSAYLYSDILILEQSICRLVR